MDDLLTRIWSDLIGRLHGPFSFRFVLQPLMAAIYAAHDGLSDAREGRPPYLWTIFTRSAQRWKLLREGWRRERRVILLGVVMDLLYQLIVFRSLHVSSSPSSCLRWRSSPTRSFAGRSIASPRSGQQQGRASGDR